MLHFVPKSIALLGVIVAAGLVTQGCATKKYVQQQVSPVDQRVTEVAQKTDENGQAIYNLESKVDQSVSRLDENIKTAERIAQDATRMAGDATRMAQSAGDTANSAYGVTQENKTQLASLNKRIDGVYNYELMTTESVIFGFDRSELSDEAKARLNEMMGKVKASPAYVIEVQGYTDKTGSAKYNLDLSEKRADSVVRYLTTTYDIPLRSLHKLGVGSEDPVADNSTRDGRSQNRRVEVRVFVPAQVAPTAMSANGNPPVTSAAKY